MNTEINKNISYCKSIVKRLSLDLSGLTVVTECASGNYAYTPIIASFAGAEKVYALGRDSKYGKYNDNKKFVCDLANYLELDNIDIQEKADFVSWGLADLITNSGLIRPIIRPVIEQLKETCVISLMWETWEFRNEDLDLKSCQKSGIVVIGTDEGYQKSDMYKYNGLMVLKILFELKAEVANGKIAILGGGMTGRLIIDTFERLGIDYVWFTMSGEGSSERCHSYNDFNKVISTEESIEAIIVAEHTNSIKLIGEEGLISYNELKDKFEHISIGHICGNISQSEIIDSGINYYPRDIAPFGYMSILPDTLSAYPVLLLNAAGLKAGEVVANSRILGDSIEQSIEKAVKHGIGQDFAGGFMRCSV